jgi:beta-aspartyl-peptidase (threonine type)
MVHANDHNAPTELAKKLETIMTTQSEAWNQGNIDQFMVAYWNDENLTFSSGGKLTRGWKSTRDGYLKRYPNRAEMGHLTFSSLESRALGSDAAITLGRWRLEREKPIEGNFTLVWEQIDSEWKIVHDHTSLFQPPAGNN